MWVVGPSSAVREDMKTRSAHRHASTQMHAQRVSRWDVSANIQYVGHIAVFSFRHSIYPSLSGGVFL